MFRTYWNSGCYDKQRNFRCQNVDDSEPQRKSTSKRTKSCVYYLPVAETNSQSKGEGNRRRVCKTFFLGVLDIGKKTVEYALKRKDHGCFVGKDLRGRGIPKNKTPKDKLNVIREHIKSFPVVASHFTRKDTKRKYFDANLSIKKMYELYVDDCKNKGRHSCGFDVYRKIFVSEFNLSFHKPKKDQCTVCSMFEENKSHGIIDEPLNE